MPFSLQNKTALVTGAGSGIGKAIALLFAAQGARVAVADLDEPSAKACALEITTAGGTSLALQCDISDSKSVNRAFLEAEKAWGAVAILVNNAGISDIGTLASTEEKRFEKVMEVNLKGQYLCARRALTGMLQNGGGVILNMCSIAAEIGLKDRFAYSVSKGGVLAMTRSIAADYMDKNIRCNCICPARVHTPFVDGFIKREYPGKEEEMFKKLSEYQPMGRMGKPEEVAALALYLCSDESAFVSGHALPMDGGVLST